MAQGGQRLLPYFNIDRDIPGGWTLGGIGEGYGNGYKLDVLAKWMEQIA